MPYALLGSNKHVGCFGSEISCYNVLTFSQACPFYSQEAFEQVLDRLLKSITKDSERMCWGRVRYLDERRIKTKIDNKAYQHVSGYDEYIRDIEWIIKQYKKTVGLGPKVIITKAVRTAVY